MQSLLRSILFPIALAGCAGHDVDDLQARTQASARAFAIEPALPAVVVARGGEASLGLTIHRGDVLGALHLSVLDAPAGLAPELAPATIAPTTDATQSTTLIVRAQADLATGTYPLRVRVDGRDAASLDVIVRDLPLPTVTLDTTLSPANVFAPDDADPAGPPRPVARLADTHSANDFIEGEIVVTSDDATALAAFAAGVGGEVVASFSPRSTGVLDVPDVHLLRFDGATADESDVVQNLAALTMDARGDLLISSRAGLGTLAVAARAQRAGLSASLQMLAMDQTYEDRVITEDPVGDPALMFSAPYSPNPFTWDHFHATTGYRTGVAEAWRALELADRLRNHVTVGVIDQGFALLDLAPTTVALGAGLNVASIGTCEVNGVTKPCPAWHGTGVSQIIAGLHDNGLGAAGVASPVVDLVIYHGNRSVFDLMQGVFDEIRAGARIINISKTIWYPALIANEVGGFNTLTTAARAAGVIIYASAGNDGRDVDADTCILFCFEDTWVTPCENDGVECVGGAVRNDQRHPGSAYGNEQVDIFAPWWNALGPDPSNNSGARVEAGSSGSAPFMAGVAALVWAADPSLSADQVVNLINATARHDASARYVKALPAVLAALGPQAPVLQVVRPADGARVSYGVTNPVLFEATADDVEDGTSGVEVVWSSDVEGLLGVGLAVSHSFTTPGPRVITATATDRNGLDTTRSIRLEVVNDAPTAVIDAPTAAASLYRGAPIALRGHATDANEGPGGVPCEDLEWSIDRVPAFTAQGCSVSGVFDVLGPARITLRATDPLGLSSERSIDVVFVEPPTQSPPLVAVLSPTPEQIIRARFPFSLSATAVDPDGTPVGFLWSVIYQGTETFLSGEASLEWRAADTIDKLCARHNAMIVLRVWDADGQATEIQIPIVLDYGPC